MRFVAIALVVSTWQSFSKPTTRTGRRLPRCARNVLRLKSCCSACRRPAPPEVCTALVVFVELAGSVPYFCVKREHACFCAGHIGELLRQGGSAKDALAMAALASAEDAHSL